MVWPHTHHILHKPVSVSLGERHLGGKHIPVTAHSFWLDEGCPDTQDQWSYMSAPAGGGTAIITQDEQTTFHEHVHLFRKSFFCCPPTLVYSQQKTQGEIFCEIHPRMLLWWL